MIISYCMKLFIYGSNLDCKRLRSRVPSWDGHYQLVYLKGYELRFHKRRRDGTGAANIVRHATSKVWGILVNMDHFEISLMDGYEGYPYHYDRLTVEVSTVAGDEITAETYVAQPDWIEEGLPQSHDYLNHVINGGKESGLPDDYIENIVEWALGNQGQY